MRKEVICSNQAELSPRRFDEGAGFEPATQ